MLTFNLTRTRFDLMTKPFQKTLVHMKDDIKEVQHTFSELRNVTQAVHKEILEDDPPLNEDDIELLSRDDTTNRKNRYSANESTVHRADDIQNRYKNKFRIRCIQQLDNGKARCRKAFANSLHNCRKKMPFILKTFLCWPFKIDFVCKINILGDPDRICDPSDAIPNDFGQTYVELTDTEERLYENNSDVNVHYTVMSPESMPEFQ